jgi:hypothetical protein
MSRDSSVFTRLVARVKALRPKDWLGLAGKRFRAGTQKLSEFAEEHHLRLGEVMDEGVELARIKVTGLASQEHAAAEKSYAEADDKKIDTELKSRSIEIELERKQAEVQKTLAETEKNYAEAAKAFSESEDKKIDSELKRRSIEIDLELKQAEVQKTRADARKAVAEAALAEVKAAEAQFELITKLSTAGMMLHRDYRGNLTVYENPAPPPALEGPPGS